MHVYELTNPEYETDQGEARANPIRMIAEHHIPTIKCPSCEGETGGGWASSDRVPVAVPETSALRSQLTVQALPVPEWSAFVERLKQELHIPPWMPVTPGAQIGLPKAELRSSRIPDLMHPFPGQIIARRRVVDALEGAGLTGFVPIRVEVTWGKRVKHDVEPPPELYELFVRGVAWRVGVDIERITVCRECGRKVFPGTFGIQVDESRWDGSDFFHVDQNPNIVLVTEGVCSVLAAHGFTNYVCTPVG